MATQSNLRQLALPFGILIAGVAVFALLILGSGSVRAAGCADVAAATATPIAAADPNAMPTAQFSKNCFEVASGQPKEFTVTLSKVSTKDVFVDIAVDDGTELGQYMGVYGIPAGQLSITSTAPSFVKLGDTIKILRVVSDGANGTPAELGSPVTAQLVAAAPPPDPCAGAYPPPTCGGDDGKTIYLPVVTLQK